MLRDLSSRQELVLLAVGLLQGEAYGYTVSSEIESQIGQRIALATIHTILYRLERDGLLISRLGGSSEVRGGRSKRLYSLTGAGVEAIRSVHEGRSRFWDQLGPVLAREMQVTG